MYYVDHNDIFNLMYCTEPGNLLNIFNYHIEGSTQVEGVIVMLAPYVHFSYHFWFLLTNYNAHVVIYCLITPTKQSKVRFK